jgi:DNA-binding transcriptional MerR regulator
VSSSSEAAEYTISAVSKLTGASCHVLRVWERRYGFPVPRRSAAGHRRYSREQVRALRAIAQLVQAGRPIGELIAAYRADALGSVAPSALDLPQGDASIHGLVDGLIAGDLAGAEGRYRRLADGLPPSELLSRVIAPCWIDVGERWFRRECAVLHERIVSEFLLRKLSLMVDAARLANTHPSHTAAIGTVQGDRHCGGVMMLSLFLERAGWRVFNLGTDVPMREYQGALRQWRCDALALSFVLSRNIKKRFQELSQIRGLPIFVGGRSILNYQGLARRHGFIPLPGPIDAAGPQLLLEYARWAGDPRR